MKHSLGCPAIAFDDPIVQKAFIARRCCRQQTRATADVGVHDENSDALTVLAGPSSFTVCASAVVVNEASDVAFPGGVAPTVKV